MSDSNLSQKASEEFLFSIRRERELNQQALGQIRLEREKLEKLLTTDVTELIHHNVEEAIKTELEKVLPEIKKQTKMLYELVRREVETQIQKAIQTVIDNV